MRKLTTIPLPAESRLLNGMTSEECLCLLNAVGATSTFYKSGETIIHIGTPLNRFWLMVSGEAHAYVNQRHGKRIVASVARGGDTFGLLFAFSGLQTHPTLMVAVKDSVVIEIPVLDPHFGVNGVERNLCLRFVSNMMSVMSYAAYQARFHAYVLSSTSIEDRITAYLCRKERFVGSSEFDLPFDRQEMADFLDVDRSALSATLSKMRKSGIIDFRKNHFKILVPIKDDDYC